jgi:hypothetical protein
MSAPNHEPIDFSSLPSLEPRSGSYEEMLARRAARAQDGASKTVAFPAKARQSARPYWASAVAALLVVGVGLGSWYGLREQPAPAPTQLAALSSSGTESSASASATGSTEQAALTEAVEWYDGLGADGTAEPLVVADALFESF